MSCMVGAAVACAVISTLANMHRERAMWAAAALVWAVLADLAFRLG